MERWGAGFAGAANGVVVVNGTNALQVALRLLGVERGCDVRSRPGLRLRLWLPSAGALADGPAA